MVKEQTLDRYTKLFSEEITRRVNHKELFKDIFLSLMAFAAIPFKSRSPSTSWCEVSYLSGDCYFPYGQGQCSNCQSDSPCPDGYNISFAYEYTTTGCWCVTQSPYITRVCCDCTPSWNHPHRRHYLDCQCPHTVQSQ